MLIASVAALVSVAVKVRNFPASPEVTTYEKSKLPKSLVAGVPARVEVPLFPEPVAVEQPEAGAVGSRR